MKRSTLVSLVAASLAVVVSVGLAVCDVFAGGGFFQQPAVGGVAISADGVVEAPTVVDQQELEAARARADLDAPAALQEFTDLRAVSLKQIEAAIAQHRERLEQLPPEIEYLAGLQRVRYIFVYPERNDIVIAGPAEGWKIDRLGNVVGRTTGRPVVKLDDLIIALRTGESSRVDPITCSIDPTEEGVRRLEQYFARKRTIGNPQQTMQEVEQALGPQEIRITGIAPTSHFARVMVAADFRMKRIAMALEEAPIAGLPSFMQMASAGRRSRNMMPRWWLAPNYKPIARTAEGLAWELRGPGVKCLTEDNFISQSGDAERAGTSNPTAEKWAALMTEKYTELADHDSSFGELRNAMDLAVVGALIAKEGLLQSAGLEIPRLMHEEAITEFPVPRQTSSKASFVKKGRDYLISASGGVEMLPWHVADSTERVESISAVRSELATDAQQWWWE